MSIKPQFSFENLKENTFFEDKFTRFKVIRTVTKWTNANGDNFKTNIALLRESFDVNAREWKFCGRTLFPLHVWAILVEHIGELDKFIQLEPEQVGM